MIKCSSLGNVFNLQQDYLDALAGAECSSLGNVFNLQRFVVSHVNVL